MLNFFQKRRAQLKRCPYCAEEIQQSALKCRYCGEWLDNGNENARPVIHEANPSTDLTERDTAKSNLTQSDDIEPKTEARPLAEDNSQDSPEIVLPMPTRPKWGWGWFVLFCTNPGFFKPGYYESAVFLLLALANPIVTLVFYFRYRKYLLNKNPYALQISHLSFKAGFISYLLALSIFVTGVVFGEIQERKEAEVVLSGIKTRFSQFHEEESKIQNQLILSPTNNKEIGANISLLMNYLKLLDGTKPAMDELTSYIQKYGSRKQKQDILAAVKDFHQDGERLFQLADDATNALIDHYKTGDEKRYKQYEALVIKWQAQQAKYASAAKTVVETFKR